MINNKNKHHLKASLKLTYREVLIFNADEDIAQPFFEALKLRRINYKISYEMELKMVTGDTGKS